MLYTGTKGACAQYPSLFEVVTKKHYIYIFIEGQQSIRQVFRKFHEMTKLGMLGAAPLPRKSGLCRKRSLPRQFSFDAPQEQTLPNRTAVMGGSMSQCTVDTRATDP